MKKIAKIIIFTSIISQITTTSYAMFCCGEEEDSGQELSSRSYSPRKMEKDIFNENEVVKNPLKTCSQKLSRDTTFSKDLYNAIQPMLYNDGSRATDYKPAPTPKRNFTFSGAKIGTDDRKRVHNTFESPWRVHGHLEMTFPNGETYIGSGTMINHRHVLTAGHCLYDKRDGGWATSIKFSPAQNENFLPIKSSYATHLLTVKGWTESRDPRFDMGMLILDRDVGEETGWYGISTNTDKFLKTLAVNVTGYPGDDDKGMGTQMWTMDGNITSVDSEQFQYVIDTTGGQSGGGVWAEFTKPKGYYCVGIHTYGWENHYNTATRISNKKFDLLVSWINKNWE